MGWNVLRRPKGRLKPHTSGNLEVWGVLIEGFLDGILLMAEIRRLPVEGGCLGFQPSTVGM